MTKTQADKVTEYDKHRRFSITYVSITYYFAIPMLAIIILYLVNLAPLAHAIGYDKTTVLLALLLGGSFALTTYLCGVAILLNVSNSHTQTMVLARINETNNYNNKNLLLGWQDIYNPATGQATTGFLKTLFSPIVLLSAITTGGMQLLIDLSIYKSGYLAHIPHITHIATAILVAWLVIALFVTGMQAKAFFKNIRYHPTNDDYIDIKPTYTTIKQADKLLNFLEKKGGYTDQTNQSIRWVEETVWSYKSLLGHVIAMQRRINDNIRLSVVVAQDLDNDIKALAKISEEDIPKIITEFSGFIYSKKDVIGACSALSNKLDNNRQTYFDNVLVLLKDVDAKLIKASELVEHKEQLQLSNDARLNELANIGFEHQSSFNEFYQLKFDSLEKKVVANNLVMSTLPELQRSLEVVKGKDRTLEKAIIKQIKQIEKFIKSIAKDTPECIESKARALDARSRDLLALDIPTEVSDDIANQLAINERYLKQRSVLSHN